MLSGARSILRRLRGGPSGPEAAAPPDTVVYVVGDIHGRLDLLYPLLGKIAFDAAKVEGGRELIFLGDYVDRGPESRGVIQKVLSTMTDPEFGDVMALKGNHEAALMSFLDDPGYWPIWTSFGAGETLSSYGVTPPGSNSDKEDWARARDELNAKMPTEHKAFLQGLALTAVRGDYLCVHAGVRPGALLADQSEQDLLWIRDDFLRSDRRLEKVIVHGHTPADEAYIGDHRIGLDTGAYATGVLTAIRLLGTERRLIQVRGVQDTRLDAEPPRLSR